MPIEIPTGIDVKQEGDIVIVKGEKGTLQERIHPNMNVIIEKDSVRIERPNDNRFNRSLHGLSRSLIQNMITGLTEGFVKKLEIIGVGYRAELKNKTLVFQLGYSHPIYFLPPEEISIELPSPTSVVVRGINKHLVGQIAAKLRSFRPPEPYKGKGIRYEGEYVRRKAGKATV